MQPRFTEIKPEICAGLNHRIEKLLELSEIDIQNVVWESLCTTAIQ